MCFVSIVGDIAAGRFNLNFSLVDFDSVFNIVNVDELNVELVVEMFNTHQLVFV